MEEIKKDGQSQTNEIPKEEVVYTEGGFEATIMKHPKTEEELVIRECFERRRLIEDGETEDEHKMRKKLLNAFNKAKTKNRGTIIHKSVTQEPVVDKEGNLLGFKKITHQYRNPNKNKK